MLTARGTSVPTGPYRVPTAPSSGPGSEDEDAIVVGRIRGKSKFGLLKSGGYSEGWPRRATGLTIHSALPGGKGHPRRAGEASQPSEKGSYCGSTRGSRPGRGLPVGEGLNLRLDEVLRVRGTAPGSRPNVGKPDHPSNCC